MEYLSGKISLRVQELNVSLETKTLDNVFVTVNVSVQYQVQLYPINIILHFYLYLFLLRF